MAKPTPEQIAEAKRQNEALKALREEIKAANPLEGFHACPAYCGSMDCPEPDPERNPTGGRPKQHEFMSSPHLVVASNAGNRFGKTTGMVVWAIIQHTPDELLPERLRQFKRPRGAKAQRKPVMGRYMCESEEWFEDNALPVFKEWMPQQILRGGSWKDGYRRSPGNVIYFRDGGQMTVPTYKKDTQALSGWSGDYVLWDEPMPQPHWNESWIRVMDREGCHRLGMTPVNMKGGGIGFIKREIFDKGDPGKNNFDPKFHILRASIWDNPDYTAEQVETALSIYPEEERNAREFGSFVHFGGMIYPDWHRYEVPAPQRADIRGKDVIVGIDPGYKTAAFVWVAFDEENRGLVFDEAYVEKGNVLDYVRTIRHTNSKWGVNDPLYVLDPYHGHKHSNTDGATVRDELMRQGIPTISPLVSDKDAIVYGGVSQIWRRMVEGGFHVSNACKRLSMEAEEYRMEDRPDGVFQVVKEHDDGMDAVRYAFTRRPWYSIKEVGPQHQEWVPGTAPSFEYFDGYEPYIEAGPMGHLS